MYRSIILIALLCTNAVAHEMTPTYPKWNVSLHDGIYKTTMPMFNNRSDIKWYEIGVFDDEWKPQGLPVFSINDARKRLESMLGHLIYLIKIEDFLPLNIHNSTVDILNI